MQLEWRLLDLVIATGVKAFWLCYCTWSAGNLTWLLHLEWRLFDLVTAPGVKAIWLVYCSWSEGYLAWLLQLEWRLFDLVIAASVKPIWLGCCSLSTGHLTCWLQLEFWFDWSSWSEACLAQLLQLEWSLFGLVVAAGVQVIWLVCYCSRRCELGAASLPRKMEDV